MTRGTKLRSKSACRTIGGKQRQGGHLLVTKAIYLGKTLVGAEEEGAVAMNGSADICAELILLEVGTRLAVELREKIVRVEDVVADEFPRAAVKVVGAGFADEVDVGAAAAAIGCVEVRS